MGSCFRAPSPSSRLRGACILGLLLLVPTQDARSHFAPIRVAPEGRDTPACGAAASPCRTIKFAVMTRTPAEGAGLVSVAEGTYAEHGILVEGALELQAEGAVVLDCLWEGVQGCMAINTTAAVSILGVAFTVRAQWLCVGVGG